MKMMIGSWTVLLALGAGDPGVPAPAGTEVPVGAWAGTAGPDEEAEAAIRATIDDVYLHAIWHEGDVLRALPGWFENCQVFEVREGALEVSPILDWFQSLHLRDVPGDPAWLFRYPRIDAVGDVGVAKVELFQGDEQRYTDYFPVVRTDGGWRILAYFGFNHRRGESMATEAEVEAATRVVMESYVQALVSEGDTATVRSGFSPEARFFKTYPELGRVGAMSLGTVLRRTGAGGPMAPGSESSLAWIDLTGTVGAAKVETRVGSDGGLTAYLLLTKVSEGWRISAVHVGLRSRREDDINAANQLDRKRNRP